MMLNAVATSLAYETHTHIMFLKERKKKKSRTK